MCKERVAHTCSVSVGRIWRCCNFGERERMLDKKSAGKYDKCIRANRLQMILPACILHYLERSKKEVGSVGCNWWYVYILQNKINLATQCIDAILANMFGPELANMFCIDFVQKSFFFFAFHIVVDFGMFGIELCTKCKQAALLAFFSFFTLGKR